ncbi:MAG: MaoC family dehydratase [Bryobacterales bacterium]|nr:MaoC family dehydratase [Bryobacterales bacterium]
MREFASMEELRACLGQEVAVGEWMEVTQERIDRFAEATGDHQWIHVNRERAARESPFGGTVAHGYLTLSLLPAMMQASIAVREPLRMTVNYGLNRLRYPAPVRAGARVRNRTALVSLDEHAMGWQAVWRQVVEIEGEEKPALVADAVMLYVRGER